jgi:L-fuculose-phosphate aldolase
MSHTKLRQGIIDTCLEMNHSGLNQGTSGNVSHRIPGGMLITPTSLPYAQMKPADIVAMDFDGTYSGRRLPSSEWRFHRDILKNRTDVNVVLHTHSVYCTTLATHELGIPSFTIWWLLLAERIFAVRIMPVSVHKNFLIRRSKRLKAGRPVFWVIMV